MKQKLIFFLFFLCSLFVSAQENTITEQTYFPKGSLSLRTNMIPWMILTPNLGIEYKPAGHIGVLIDGAFAHWDWDNDNRHHRLWFINPQVRYYTGELKGSYIGVEGKAGQYNFKWNGSDDSGNQGEFFGGGLTLGHQFDCGRNLMVDLGLSFGYLYLHDMEEYIRLNGQDYRISKKSKGYWGPTGITMSLVWKIK